MTDERDAEFWNTHCWSKRFNNDPSEACAEPATWRGPQDAPDSLTRAWRACYKHRMAGDEPFTPDATARGEK